MRLHEIIDPRLREAAPTDQLRAQALYHGTATTAAAKGIMANGLRPDQATTYSHELTPTQGHIYLTPDATYAIKYAIGPDARTRMASEYKDRYCYLFKFDGSSLEDVVPDEDSIGDFMWLNTVPAAGGGKGKRAWAFDHRRAGADADAKYEVWSFLFHRASAKEIKGCCTLGPNRPYAWAAFGKRMQPIIPERMAQKMIEWERTSPTKESFTPRNAGNWIENTSTRSRIIPQVFSILPR